MSETTTTTLPAGTWTLDTAHSHVGFTVRHMMVSKVRGPFGTSAPTSSPPRPAASRRSRATVQMASIDTGDEGRDGHLRTNDFFDIEQFPTMTFTSTGITGSGSDYEVTGDLTIKGVTKPVTFDLEFGGVGKDPWGNTRAGFTLTGTINRKDFGMEYNACSRAAASCRRQGASSSTSRPRSRRDVVNVTGLNHAVLWVRDARPARLLPEALGFTVVEATRRAGVFLRAGASNHHDLGLFSSATPGPAAHARAVPPGLAGRHDRGPRRAPPS